MQYENLGPVEQKVLGALIILAGGANTVKVTLKEIANTMGYKTSGGAITYAIRGLERDNFIAKLPTFKKSVYRLLI